MAQQRGVWVHGHEGWVKAAPEVGEVWREDGLAAGFAKGSRGVDRIATLCILLSPQGTPRISNQLAGHAEHVPRPHYSVRKAE